MFDMTIDNLSRLFFSSLVRLGAHQAFGWR
jgi:hypothetical protein